MVTRRTARFAELSDALYAECERRGRPLQPGEAEEMLSSRLSIVAMSMGMRESSALRYFTDDWPVKMAEGRNAAAEAEAEAEAAGESEPVQDGPPVVMPTLVAAQLVSALGVAAKFAAINAEHADHGECVDAACQAGDALTVIGASLRAGVETPEHAAGMPVVSVEHGAMVFARNAMRVFSARLADGSWRDCWCGIDEFGHLDIPQLRRQVDSDLELVERVLNRA